MPHTHHLFLMIGLLRCINISKKRILMHDPASKSCSSYRFFDILEIRCNKVTDKVVSELLSRYITFVKWRRTFWLYPFTSQEHWGAEPQSCLWIVWNVLFGEPSQHFMYASQKKTVHQKKKIFKCQKISDMWRYMSWSLDSPSEKGFDSFFGAQLHDDDGKWCLFRQQRDESVGKHCGGCRAKPLQNSPRW